MATLLAFNFDSDEALKDVLTHGGRILLVIVIAVIAVRVITSLVTPVVRIAIREQMLAEPQVEVDKRIETLSHVISRTVVVMVTIAAFLTALPEIGLNVGPLIAGVGIVGIAIGLGAQNLVRDIVNGLFILLENQYGRGDVVKIGEISGTVEDLNLRRTVLRDMDGVVHFIPHGEVKTASNMTRGFSRVNLNVAVGRTTDVATAFRVIDRVGAELADDPQWRERVREPRAPSGLTSWATPRSRLRSWGLPPPASSGP